MTVKVDGINGLTFADNSTQNVTALNASNITSGTLGKARMATGTVLQVVQAWTNDKFSYSAADTNYYDVTGLSLSITPTSASSKILLMASVLISTTNAGYYSLMGVRFARNSTAIGTGGGDFNSGIASVTAADSSSAYASVPLLYLDSPATTSATTYKIQINQRIGGTVVIQVNASRGGGQIGSSNIVAMEIAG